MHYPKVLERVDSPEQIFHRSFSLGAPSHVVIGVYLPLEDSETRPNYM